MRRQAKATPAGSIDGSGKSRGLLIVALAVVASLAFGAGTALAAAPTLSVDSGPTAAYTSAEVSGHLDPADNEVFYWFQYAVDPDAEGWSNGPQAFSRVKGPGTGNEAVSEELTGLKPGTEYKVRLLAFKTDFSGEEWASASPYETFTTEPVTAPTVALDPITTHSDTTAELKGHVDPNAPGGSLSDAAKAAYLTSWHYTCTPECPVFSNGAGSVEAEAGEQAADSDATGLEPNTTYEVTIEAGNAGGSDIDTQTFSTDEILPGVKAAPGAPDGKAGYTLQGIVNPHNSAITGCEFEYGLTTAYGEEVPCDVDPGAVNKGVEVTAHIGGLTVGIDYHFNLVATNGAGEEESGDATFAPTQDPAAPACPNEALRAENNSLDLPECRAYELVTNAYKEGFATINALRYTDDAVAYLSFGTFAGAGLSQQLNQYVARRTATKWLTTSPNPSGPAYSVDIVEGAEAMSADLGSSLWLMRRPDQSTDLVDYYLRGPDGVFTRVGPAINPVSQRPGTPGTANPLRVGLRPWGSAVVSQDLSHLVFSVFSEDSFPGDTTLAPNQSLYEYVGTGNERPELVGVDNTGQLVSSGGTCSNGMSTDGRVVLFNPGCGANQLWARINQTTSIRVSASECTRTSADPGGACNGPGEVTLAGMESDGSRVFFTTSQQLLNDDTDETSDLYACDIPPGTPAPVGTANPCASLTRISGPGQGADVQGVTRFSSDGSHVYFIAHGVLAANPGANDAPAVTGDNNLYVWQKDAAHAAGQTTFIGKSEGEVRSSITPEGRYLAFTNAAQLVPGDTDSAPDVYRYDSATGALVRVSTAASGTGGNDSAFEALAAGLGQAITADGETIIFTTAEQLSPGDTDAAKDVYLWHDGRVSRVSSGGGEEPAITPSGENVFFKTDRPLTAADGDTNFDTYSARIDGGFSFATAAPCSGEACQGSVSGALASKSPSTEGAGPGNRQSPRACPKGKVRKHGKCVKKKNHGKKASHNRGGGK